MRDLYVASCAADGGIYHYKLDEAGNTSFCDKRELERPMFLAYEDNKMYALLRAPFNNDFSGVAVMNISEDGCLGESMSLKSTKGVVGCHLWVENGDIYAVNYLSGSVIKMPNRLDTHSGKGLNPERQSEPHTHYVRVTPDKKYVCATDLGLDTIFFYDRDLNFKFSVKTPAGHGARHIEFSEDGKIMYCVNELKSTVSVFRYNEEKTELLRTYNTLPQDFEGENLAAAVRVHKGYLYVSNRGYDGVTSFKIVGDELNVTGYEKTGAHPRDINIFGDILVSANMYDNSVTFFKVCDGKLTRLDNVIKDIKEPLCVIAI